MQLEEDKQRILAIVEASFGSSIQFNAACRQILVSKLSGAAKSSKARDKKGEDDGSHRCAGAAMR